MSQPAICPVGSTAAPVKVLKPTLEVPLTGDWEVVERLGVMGGGGDE